MLFPFIVMLHMSSYPLCPRKGASKMNYWTIEFEGVKFGQGKIILARGNPKVRIVQNP